MPKFSSVHFEGATESLRPPRGLCNSLFISLAKGRFDEKVITTVVAGINMYRLISEMLFAGTDILVPSELILILTELFLALTEPILSLTEPILSLSELIQALNKMALF